MGWNYRECDEKKDAVIALTKEQQEALTWETALQYVPMDTLCLATWQGELDRKLVTPYQALCRVHCIQAQP